MKQYLNNFRLSFLIMAMLAMTVTFTACDDEEWTEPTQVQVLNNGMYEAISVEGSYFENGDANNYSFEVENQKIIKQYEYDNTKWCLLTSFPINNENTVYDLHDGTYEISFNNRTNVFIVKANKNISVDIVDADIELTKEYTENLVGVWFREWVTAKETRTYNSNGTGTYLLIERGSNAVKQTYTFKWYIQNSAIYETNNDITISYKIHTLTMQALRIQDPNRSSAYWLYEKIN